MPHQIICVNADGSAERRTIGAPLHQIADFERGRAWMRASNANNGRSSVQVYTEIPWSSYSHRTPKAQKEFEEECMRKVEAGGVVNR